MALFLLIALACVIGCVKSDDWEYEVTYAQMASGEPLPAGDQFFITVESYNVSDACLQMGDDEVGISLQLGEFVTQWKQITLSLFDDPDEYRTLVEMQGSQNPYSTIFSTLELIKYRLCFWKDDGGIVNSRRNFYMMVDAMDALLPQHLYTFYWVRDE